MRRYNYAVLALFIVSFLVLFPSWDKYWAPYDEGNYLITARMVTEGMVPYRDFLLAMYPPAYAFLLAFLFKLFGLHFLVTRMYNIVLFSLISTSVFCIARKIASFKYSLISFLLCLGALAGWGEPPIPRPIWPGVALSLLGVLFILDFIESGKMTYFALSSLFTGATVIFRHDIGLLTFSAVALGILLYSVNAVEGKKNAFLVSKKALGFLVAYSAMPFLFSALLFIWLAKTGALEEAYRAMFTLPFTFNKWAAIPFPAFCTDFGMIFHRGCLFIKNNKFYIPPVVCAAGTMLFFMEVFAKRKLDKRTIALLLLTVLAFFYLQQLVFRTDGNHLAVSFPPAAILFGTFFTYNAAATARPKPLFLKVFKIAVISYVSLLMALFFYQSLEKYIKDIYVKPFVKKNIEPVSFGQGTVYVPADGRRAFVELAKYISDNTQKGEMIYIGHLHHKVPQMGWFDLLYFVTDRLPAVRYHIMIPGFQSRDDIQEEMVADLKRNNVRVILLRDFGKTDAIGPLDRYIRGNYNLDRLIDNYHIYVRR